MFNISMTFSASEPQTEEYNLASGEHLEPAEHTTGACSESVCSQQDGVYLRVSSLTLRALSRCQLPLCNLIYLIHEHTPPLSLSELTVSPHLLGKREENLNTRPAFYFSAVAR